MSAERSGYFYHIKNSEPEFFEGQDKFEYIKTRNIDFYNLQNPIMIYNYPGYSQWLTFSNRSSETVIFDLLVKFFASKMDRDIFKVKLIAF